MKNILQCCFLFSAIFMVFSLQLPAQTQLTTTPLASPKAKVMQTVGLTDVAVVYHRPAVKDREIWGKLVPLGQTWRAGANDNTVIKFSKDVSINGEPLAAGKYGFHIIPFDDKATLIFSNNSTSWGSYSYNKAEDALRVDIQPQKADHFHEYLTYSFEPKGMDSAVCALQWGNQKFAFTIETNVQETVLASLRNELRSKAGWTWSGWNEAANFCLQNDVNHKEALSWATRSVFMSPNPANLMTKARLTAKVKGAEGEKEQQVILASLGEDLSKQNVTWKEWHAASNVAMKNKDYDKALTWVDQSIAMSPNMTNMMSKSGVLKAKGDEKKAAQIKEKAIAKGTNAELNLYAYQLMWSGKTAEAVEIFEANADKYADDPNVWDSLGEGYYNNGQKEKAIKALKKCLSLDPPANIKGNSLNLLQQMGVEYDKKTIQP
jgi:tetratricopeptide (TPR) repeat protein